jgi:hypothetical protein
MEGSAFNCESSATVFIITNLKTAHHLCQQSLQPVTVAPLLLELIHQLLRPFELGGESSHAPDVSMSATASC